MIGFYVLCASEPNGEVKGDLRRAVMHETTFIPANENSAEVELQGQQPYVVMPCTYSPGRHARFSIAVTSSLDFDFAEMQHHHNHHHHSHHSHAHGQQS